MSGKVRLGIIAASLCLTAALAWGGASLAILFVQWISEESGVAKAMPLLPVFVLPLTALVLYRRRGRATISA